MGGVQAMVRDHAGDSRWGAHAHAIAHGNMWKPPGNGGHDDKVCLVTFIIQRHGHMCAEAWQACIDTRSA